MNINLHIDPLLPEMFLWIFGATFVAILALLLWRRQRGTLLRSIAFLAMFLAMLNPSITEIDQERLPSIVAVVTDNSDSARLAGRPDLIKQVRNAVAERFEGLDDFDIRWTSQLPAAASTQSAISGGTRLFSGLARLLADVPPEQVAGAIIITDGQIHDVPATMSSLGFNAPVHVILAGAKNEKDRRIILHRAPRFGLVDQKQQVTFRVQESGFGARSAPGPESRVTVVLRRDGEEIGSRSVAIGNNVTIELEVAHAGANVFELVAAPLAGELTQANNRAVLSIEGIRENLRVLLVSGEPHAGERTWRNLLKSDAAVDLVHFTILRPPEKQDGTPINQLSLIAFPTRELFSAKIQDFDLIILDRYRRRGVLPIIYFDNIASYVRDGGALLVAAGPEYSSSGSLFRTPVSPVLPASPTGLIMNVPFRPEVTETGDKHPVTRLLQETGNNNQEWGRWLRAIETEVIRGETVMSGPANTPLLVLSREERGRVALLLSDQAWLWSRGFEGGGPQISLLRRLSHWLMKEPDLEEERLIARHMGDALIIERRTMQDHVNPITVTMPNGETRSPELQSIAPGIWQGTMRPRGLGVYHIADKTLKTLTNVGALNPLELADVVTTDHRVSPLVEDTGGSIYWTGAVGGPDFDMPRIVPLRSATQWSGSGWIGLKRADVFVVRDTRSLPLFYGILGLILLLGSLTASWFREGR